MAATGSSDDVETGGTAGGDSFYTPSGKRNVSGAYVQDKLTWDWLEVIAGLRYDSYSLNGDSSRNIRRQAVAAHHRRCLAIRKHGPCRSAVLRHLCRRLPVAVAHRNADQRQPSSRRHLPVPAQSRSASPKPARPGSSASTTLTTVVESGDALRLKAAYFNNDVDDYIERRDALGLRPDQRLPVPPDYRHPASIPICFQYAELRQGQDQRLRTGKRLRRRLGFCRALGLDHRRPHHLL